MPTASGRRSGAVCGEKSPKLRLARIYCYGNALYIETLDKGCLRGSLYKVNVLNFNSPSFRTPAGSAFFFF